MSLGRTPSPARLVVLAGAGHDHFADDVPAIGPTSIQAEAFTRSLALAHLDATLHASADAGAFLASAPALLAPRGIPSQLESNGR